MKNKKIVFSILIFFLILFISGCKNNIEETNKLVDLSNKTEEQIYEQFKDQGLIVTIDFKDYYVENTTERTFIKYGENHSVGDEVSNGDLITIYISSPSIVLPNLTGLNRAEISEIFTSLGVPNSKLSFQGDVSRNVVPGTFISYNNVSSGARYEFKSRLVIYYDLSTYLPDSSGMNIHQIKKQFDDLSIPVTFNYTIDNTKEFNSFESYENFSVGDSVSALDTIEVNIYINDDVNVGLEVVNEKQIFISKYVDGKGINQAIELFNPTNEDVSLTNYYLAILSNGSLTATQTIDFTGSLAPGKTYVIARTGARQSILDKADLVSDKLIFDGNDTVQLRKKDNNTYIDSVYHVGNISTTMDEEIFVRKSHITAGNREFSQLEWWGFIPTYDDVIGAHPANIPSGPEFVLIPDKVYPEYGMTLVEVTSVADGDTIYLNSLDSRDTTSYQGDSRIRFLMVDTPETQKPGQPGQPYAQVATRFTTRLLNNASEIYLQADPSGSLTETYGRHLGLIWFNLENDEVFDDIAKEGSVTIKAGWHLLNYELIKYGLGEKNIAKTTGYEKSPIFSNVYLYQWGEEALAYAKQYELGIYSGIHRT